MGKESEVELTTGVLEEQETQATDINITVSEPFKGWQDEFVRCTAKRQVVMAGRQSAKTFADAIKAVTAFLGTCWNCLGDGCIQCDNTGRVPQRRVLYAAPSSNQLEAFWFEVVDMLRPGIEHGIYKKDETEHTIEIPNTNLMIKAQTAWNVNMLRGRNWDVIIFDEYQLMNEQVWTVGAPMLLLSNGTAIFTFTPPSLTSEGVIHAQDPRHAGKMYKKYVEDDSGIWKCFHATSLDNPYLNREALDLITKDMSIDSYKREILAQIEEIESSWLVYGKFDDNSQIIKRFTIPDSWNVYSGHDFGEANPACLFVAQVKLPLPPGAPDYLRYGDYVAFSEYAPGASSAEQHIDKFKEILDKRNLVRAVGGNVTTEEQTRQLYQKLKWNIRAPEITRVNLQVDRAISLIENRQFYVFEDLHQLLAQLHDCMWVVDTETKKSTNKIRDEARYHFLACWRYLATALAVKRVTGESEMAHAYVAGRKIW